MDYSFHSYHCHLAEMTTDQRELEQHHLSVQTGVSGSEGILQISASQPYEPWSLAENWTPSRSTLVPQSMSSPQHPGYTDSWSATMSDPYNTNSSYSRDLVAENTYLLPEYSASTSNLPPIITSPAIMEQPTCELKRIDHDDPYNWQADPLSAWVDQRTCYTTKLEGDRSFHTSRAASPSPPISLSSYQSSSQSPESASPGGITSTADGNSPRTSFGGDHSEEEHVSDLPYSQLIFQALMSTEERKMPLQEIYSWFEQHTNKGKDQACKGWQNSIRHNLSMNAVRALSLHCHRHFQTLFLLAYLTPIYALGTLIN